MDVNVPDKNMAREFEDKNKKNMHEIQNPDNGVGFNIPGADNQIKRTPGKLDSTPEELMEIGKQKVYVKKPTNIQPQIAEPQNNGGDTKRGNTHISSATFQEITKKEGTHGVNLLERDTEERAEKRYRAKGEPRRLPKPVENLVRVGALAATIATAAGVGNEINRRVAQASVQTVDNPDVNTQPVGPVRSKADLTKSLDQERIEHEIEEQEAIIKSAESNQNLDGPIKRSVITRAKEKIASYGAQIKAIFSKGEKPGEKDLTHKAGDGMVKAETGTSVEAEAAKIKYVAIESIAVKPDGSLDIKRYETRNPKDNILAADEFVKVRTDLETALSETSNFINLTHDTQMKSYNQFTAIVRGFKEAPDAPVTPEPSINNPFEAVIIPAGEGAQYGGFYIKGKFVAQYSYRELWDAMGWTNAPGEGLYLRIATDGSGIEAVNSKTGASYAKGAPGDRAGLIDWKKVGEAPKAVNTDNVITNWNTQDVSKNNIKVENLPAQMQELINTRPDRAYVIPGTEITINVSDSMFNMISADAKHDVSGDLTQIRILGGSDAESKRQKSVIELGNAINKNGTPTEFYNLKTKKIEKKSFKGNKLPPIILQVETTTDQDNLKEKWGGKFIPPVSYVTRKGVTIANFINEDGIIEIHYFFDRTQGLDSKDMTKKIYLGLLFALSNKQVKGKPADLENFLNTLDPYLTVDIKDSEGRADKLGCWFVADSELEIRKKLGNNVDGR